MTLRLTARAMLVKALLCATVVLPAGCFPQPEQLSPVRIFVPSLSAVPAWVLPDRRGGALFIDPFEPVTYARVSPAGVLTENEISKPLLDVRGATAGKYGAVWLSTTSGDVVRLEGTRLRAAARVPSRYGNPGDLVVDSAGTFIVMLPEFDGIAWVRPGGTASILKLHGDKMIQGPVLGTDGVLYALRDFNGPIIAIGPSRSVEEIRTPRGRDIEGLAAAPDGTIWFSEPETNQIGHIRKNAVDEVSVLDRPVLRGPIAATRHVVWVAAQYGLVEYIPRTGVSRYIAINEGEQLEALSGDEDDSVWGVAHTQHNCFVGTCHWLFHVRAEPAP